ncbi:MAG: WD40/YVTN/BNR-like repeat-containing protein, partial [Chitinophagaceae bacterium]
IEMNGVFIIGTFKKGILLSRDSGRHWKSADNNISHTAVRCLAVHQNKILAGTDDGIYESTDKGNSWRQLFRGSQVNGFANLHHKVYAATADGALISENGGIRWKYIYKSHTLHDIANDGEYIYAMTLGEGLLRSNNDGLSWSNVNHGLGPANLYTFEVKNINHELFAAQWKGIYRSEDGGKSWQLLNKGLPASTSFTTLEVVPGGLIAGIGLRKK